MVNYLALKRRRDIRRQRWQFMAVFITITLGVMMFAASYDAYLNLESSYSGTYDRLGFADMTVSGADDSFVSAARQIDGVAAVETRTVADLPVRIGSDTFNGHIIGMPTDQQPQIDKIDVTDGSYLDSSQPSGVVVESHVVDTFDAPVGTQLEVFNGATWTPADIIGVGVSSEYLWLAESRQNIFPAPGTFGVVFADEDIVASLPKQVIVDQALVLYDHDADRATVDAAVEAAAHEAGAAAVVPQAKNASNAAVKLDVQGFEQLSVMFPLLFLLAAGMATFVILTRVVYSQRSQIGTLTASGMSRRTITRHYLSYGLILGIGGAVLGTILGMAAGWAMTGLYTDSLGIPDTVRHIHAITPIGGLLFGVAVGLLSAWAPTRAASRVSPAEAMRGEVIVGKGSRSLLERLLPPVRRLPVRWLMVLRGIGRNRRRSASTVIGVVLALTLILASWGMIDTTVNLIDRNFNQIQLEDATVVLQVPVDQAQLDTLAAIDGVSDVEPVITLDAAVKGPDGSYATQLQAYPAGTAMHGFDTPSGELPSSGIVVGEAMRSEIGIDVGDAVTISFPTLETSITTTLAGFVNEPLGTLAYMERAAFESAVATADPPVTETTLDQPSTTTVMVRYADGVDDAHVLDEMKGLATTATVIDSRAFYRTVQSFLGFFYVFVGLMLAFGGIMAFALLFNTISVNVAERQGEYATMRANGLSLRELANLITGENILLTVLGIVPGLVIGYLAAVVFMRSYSSDMFTFALDMNVSTLVLSALAMIVVVLISVVPAIRTMRRLDIPAVVRERSV